MTAPIMVKLFFQATPDCGFYGGAQHTWTDGVAHTVKKSYANDLVATYPHNFYVEGDKKPEIPDTRPVVRELRDPLIVAKIKVLRAHAKNPALAGDVKAKVETFLEEKITPGPASFETLKSNLDDLCREMEDSILGVQVDSGPESPETDSEE